MTRIVLGVGSNVDRRRSIRAGLGALRERFGELTISPVYRCPAEGFDGAEFFNLVVVCRTSLSPGAVDRELKHIEDGLGRDRDGQRWSDRTLDIDLLLYGDATGDVEGIELPRDEILRFAFVLKPLSDLLPDEHHPVDGRSYQELWQVMAATGHSLTPVTDLAL